jgi:hypothetical protein
MRRRFFKVPWGTLNAHETRPDMLYIARPMRAFVSFLMPWHLREKLSEHKN